MNTKKVREIWVIGSGKFGSLAVSRICRHFPFARITVVDHVPPDNPISEATRIVADGVVWLDQMLTETAPVDLIVPSVPIHLAVRWMMRRLGETHEARPIPVDDRWLVRMPNSMAGGEPGQVFVSHADFICPDHCPEPADRCTMTGKPRPTDLFQLLPRVTPCGIQSVVVRSHQLLPGVGGLLPEALLAALETVRRYADQPLMIATACRCHGVVNFIRLVRKPRIQSVF